MSSELVREWLGDHVVDQRWPSVVPFFTMVEVGWHAFDFSAGAEAHIVDVDAELLWKPTQSSDFLVNRLAEWLEAFLEAGFKPFATKDHLVAAQ